MPSSAHATGRKPFADPPDALVVVRLDRRVLAEERAEPALRSAIETSWSEKTPGVCLCLSSPDDLRQVLDEVAAARDVQQLRAAADRQHRHVPRERRLEQRELGAVALAASMPSVAGCASAP